MKIELEYNIKAIIYHVDIDHGWLMMDFDNPIVWVNEHGILQKVQTISFGWNYESTDELNQFVEVITNILQNSYSDEELLKVIPITDKRIRTLEKTYPCLNEVPNDDIKKEVIKAIRLAALDIML